MGIRLLLKVNKLVCCSFDKASGEIGILKLFLSLAKMIHALSFVLFYPLLFGLLLST